MLGAGSPALGGPLSCDWGFPRRAFTSRANQLVDQFDLSGEMRDDAGFHPATWTALPTTRQQDPSLSRLSCCL